MDTLNSNLNSTELIKELETMRQNLYDEETRNLGIYSEDKHCNSVASEAMRNITRIRKERDVLSKAIEFIKSWE